MGTRKCWKIWLCLLALLGVLLFTGAGAAESAEEDIGINGPHLLVAGQDLVFTLTGTAKLDMDYSTVEVSDTFGNEVEYFGRIQDTFTVKANKFEAGKWYRVELWGRDTEENRVSIYLYFFVCNSVEEGITGTVNGQKQGEALIGEKFTVTFSAPGAKALYIGEESFWQLCNDFNPETGIGTISGTQSYVGTFGYMARAYYGDLTADEIRDTVWGGNGESLEWSNPCQPVTVKVTALGRVGVPVLKVPTTVVRGDLLPVEVLSADHATSLDFCIPKSLGPGRHENLEAPNYDDVGIPFTGYLPTAQLDPSGQYCVMVWAKATGYEESETEYDYYNFTVVEPRDEINLQLDRTTAGIYERVWTTVIAPGATKVRISYETDNGDSDTETKNMDNMRWDVLPTRAGTYTFTAEAYYDGEWRKASSTIQLTVTNENDLKAPAATYPSIIPDGPFSFSFTGVKKAEAYDLEITDAATNEVCAQKTYTRAGSYTLDDIQLEKGKVYTAQLTARAEGKTSGTGKAHDFAVVDPGKILILPDDLTTIEANAFEGTDAQVVVIPGGLTSIGAGAFDSTDVIALVVPDGVTGIDFKAIFNSDYLVITDSY